MLLQLVLSDTNGCQSVWVSTVFVHVQFCQSLMQTSLAGVRGCLGWTERIRWLKLIGLMPLNTVSLIVKHVLAKFTAYLIKTRNSTNYMVKVFNSWTYFVPNTSEPICSAPNEQFKQLLNKTCLPNFLLNPHLAESSPCSEKFPDEDISRASLAVLHSSTQAPLSVLGRESGGGGRRRRLSGFFFSLPKNCRLGLNRKLADCFCSLAT